MTKTFSLLVSLLCAFLGASLHATTYGSVEPTANSAVVDVSAFDSQPLRVREAFANRMYECGVVNRVIDALTSTGAITTVNALNARFSVGAGGFAGRTNPAFVFTITDDGPNGASADDIRVLTDGLGYVMSQASAFLLDADDVFGYDFPANFVVINFAVPPPLSDSAQLFRTVGQIDSELFATDTSGYTQYGRAYLSLQSDVPNDRFIAGYRKAARRLGLEYTPVVDGEPSVSAGGAAFPGNDWSVSTRGEEYLERIPARSHRALERIREFHLRATKDVLRKLERHNGRPIDDVVSFGCR